MPQEPKKKHSKARKRTRRASIKLASINIVVCSNCNAKTLSHMACRSCGFYGGKAVKGTKTDVKVIRA